MLQISPHISPPKACLPAAPAGEILEARLQAAIGKVAQLVVDDPTFIPVFERLEQELADLRTQSDTIARARKYLTG